METNCAPLCKSCWRAHVVFHLTQASRPSPGPLLSLTIVREKPLRWKGSWNWASLCKLTQHEYIWQVDVHLKWLRTPATKRQGLWHIKPDKPMYVLNDLMGRPCLSEFDSWSFLPWDFASPFLRNEWIWWIPCSSDTNLADLKALYIHLAHLKNLSEFQPRLNLSGDISFHTLESLDYGQRTPTGKWQSSVFWKVHIWTSWTAHFLKGPGVF